MQNIKMDLVYYKTATDFEMEFNLCGCCRMRLLNDKASDQKTLLLSLSRAVSRSKIIMVTGPLFGEDGVTALAAGALNSSTVVADNATYGIKGDQEIQILKGSTPLVTPEGYFGGCIIECGPQTMILISDNKNIRKSIMQTLIHPYIEETAAGNPAQTKIEENTEETTAEEEVLTEIIVEPEVESEEESIEEAVEEEETTEETVEEPTIDEAEEIVMENSDEQLYKPDPNALIQENHDYEYELGNNVFVTEVTPPPIFNFEGMEDEGSADDYVSEDDYGDYRKPFDLMKALNMSILLMVIFLSIILIILCYCIFYVPSKEGIDAATYISDIYNALFG